MQTHSQSLPCILFLALMCAGPACAQTDEDDAKIIELSAKMFFKADIDAGRLTLQKASALFKCANDRYAQKLTPEKAVALSEAIEAMTSDAKLSDADKARHGRTYKDLGKLQREAEDGCRKELGIDPAVQRVFQGLGTKRR
jgi:hypothetical protein